MEVFGGSKARTGAGALAGCRPAPCAGLATFPKEERYSLTDQIRRSSRGVAANIAEGFRKRRYPNVFVNKLADSDAEAAETQVWLDFARDCGYLSLEKHQRLRAGYEEVGKMLGSMIATRGGLRVDNSARCLLLPAYCLLPTAYWPLWF